MQLQAASSSFLLTVTRSSFHYVSANKCPKGFDLNPLKFQTRNDYTLSQWGSPDDVNCALHKTKAKCFKPNGRTKKWLTFTRGQVSTFTIEKEAQFSVTQTVGFPQTDSTTTTTTDTSTFTGGSTSTSVVQRFFAVRRLSFRVRGAFRIIIELVGVITQVVRVKTSV